MRIDRDDFKIEKSADFTSLQFDMANPAIIFDILCNRLYERPLRTLVQEYCSNARDSHREADIADIPIKIILPTRLQKVLKIVDFGVGISPDRMETVFIKLGASTKNGDNVQTGGFGLGCKIGFSYTDSFSIKTTYNGTSYEYLAFMNDNGIPHLDLITKFSTLDDNYTSIEVAIYDKDLLNVEGYVYQTCHFWDVKPIIINSDIKFIELNDKFNTCYINYYEVHDTYLEEYRESMSLVVDGIIYRGIDKKFDKFRDLFIYKYSTALFITVNTGDVDLAINRENLQYTSKTLNKLNDIYELIYKKISSLSIVQDGCTIDKILNIINDNKHILSMLRNFNMTINGDMVTIHNSMIKLKLLRSFVTIHTYKSYYNRSGTFSLRIDKERTYVELLNTTTLNVVNDTTKLPTNNSIRSYMQHNNIGTCNIITIDDISNVENVEYINSFGLQKLSDINMKHKKSTISQNDLCVFRVGRSYEKLKKSTLTDYLYDDVIYITHSEYMDSNIDNYNTIIKYYNDISGVQYTLLKVSKVINDKITDIIPSAIHISKFIENVSKYIDNKLSTRDILNFISKDDSIYYSNLYRNIKSLHSVYHNELFDKFINIVNANNIKHDRHTTRPLFNIYKILNEHGYKYVMAKNILKRNIKKYNNIITNIENKYKLLKNSYVIKNIDNDAFLEYVKMVDHCKSTGYEV